jgi:hypothetical protein
LSYNSSALQSPSIRRATDGRTTSGFVLLSGGQLGIVHLDENEGASRVTEVDPFNK